MPIMDSQLLFSESQDISGNSGTAEDSSSVVYIPQVYDHTKTAGNDRPNVSGDLYLNVVCEDTDLAAASNSCALTIALYADTDDTTPTTDGDVILTKTISVNQTSNYPKGTLIWCQALPSETFKPYLAIKYSRATQNLSTGAVTAWIGPPVQLGK